MRQRGWVGGYNGLGGYEPQRGWVGGYNGLEGMSHRESGLEGMADGEANLSPPVNKSMVGLLGPDGGKLPALALEGAGRKGGGGGGALGL